MTTNAAMNAVEPGFADPALDAQRVFRALMDAMARPGTIADLSFAPRPSLALPPAAAAIALTLLDGDTPVWLHDDLAKPSVLAWLRFHCGCPIGSSRDSAFAFATARAAPPLESLNLGESRYPDRATTLVLVCDSLLGGPALQLSGPGIAHTSEIAPHGPGRSLWEQRASLFARFPLGIDILLAAPDAVMALPRTTRVTICET